MKTAEKRKLINDSIKLINKARQEFGLGPIELIKGNLQKSNSCVIVKGLGIRTKVDGVDAYVRSKKSAERLAKVWGTAYHKVEAECLLGRKDYPYNVTLPETLNDFALQFDLGHLADLAHQERKTFVRGREVVEQSFRSTIKKVDHVVCSPETAIKIVDYLRK